MDKEVQKERAGLIRHLFTLPDPVRGASSYSRESLDICLCAQGQVVKRYLGYAGEVPNSKGMDYPFYDNLNSALKSIEMSKDQWCEMEMRYEGDDSWTHEEHSFKQIATWLQTLEGWPTVL